MSKGGHQQSIGLRYHLGSCCW